MARINFEKDPTGFSKIEAVSKYWGFVQEENEAHKKYVTPSQWNSWQSFNEETSAKLSKVIDNFDFFRLSEAQNSVLNEIIERIEAATRKTTADFEKELGVKRVEMQKQVADKSHEEEVKVRKGWLFNLFKQK